MSELSFDSIVVTDSNKTGALESWITPSESAFKIDLSKKLNFADRSIILDVTTSDPAVRYAEGHSDYVNRFESIRRNAAIKRGMDLIGATLALLLFLPLLLVVAALIKCSSQGPVLFRQERVGRNGARFKIYKFRSMRSDCCDASGVTQTMANDERLTAIGSFIRQRSIDELPQLLNILKGDMSFVGPRPHVPGMLAGGRPYDELVPYYSLRQAVTPGLTGWAQINGWRGPTDEPTAARARIDHDIAYIQNYSIWLDFKIMVVTAWRELVIGTGV